MTLAAEFTTLQTAVAEARGRLQAQEDVVTGLQATVAAHETEVGILALVNTTLESLMHQVNADSLGQIEALVSFGLSSVFPDLPLAFTLPITTKRGVASIEPRLQLGAIEGPILDSFGGGPAAVIAFLLRLLVVRRAQLAPLIVCDESFSMVSSQYIPNLSKLLKELAARFHMTFLVITHDPGLAELADHRYLISDTAEGAVFTER